MLENFRAGLMPSIYINAHRQKGKTRVMPLELFGQQMPQRPSTAEEIRLHLTLLAMQGKNNG